MGVGRDIPEIEETLIPAFGGVFILLGGTSGAPAALALLGAAAEEHWAVGGALAAWLGAGGRAGGVGGGRGGGEVGGGQGCGLVVLFDGGFLVCVCCMCCSLWQLCVNVVM